MLRVEAPHFVAGIECDGGRMTRPAAPVLRWAVGHTLMQFIDYCHRKHWKVMLL